MSDIKLFVTHTPNTENYLIKRDFVCNVVAGSDFQVKEMPEGLIADNTGENISAKNKSYCELTTLYWAWKNVELDYYGFCHYRRLLSLSPDPLPGNRDWGVFQYDDLNEDALSELCWDEESLNSCVDGYDFLIAQHIDTGDLGAKDVWTHWQNAQELRNGDYQLFLKIIHEIYPDFGGIADDFSRNRTFYPCNMFIAKRELLDEYCSMLFPLLDEFEKRTDMSTYSVEGKRITGHLAERFTGMYFEYLKKKGSYRLKELEVAYFSNTKTQKEIKPNTQNSLPIVLACNDGYVPYLDVCLSSLYRHSSKDHIYDVVILSNDISEVSKGRLLERASTYNNVNLLFVDVAPLLKGYDLAIQGIISHVTVETFYRFLILDVMKDFEKVLYLDCDMLIQDDVSALFDEELGDALVGAVLDADYLANLNMYDDPTSSDSSRYKYSKTVLKMDDPYTYFQAGMIMFNIPELRKVTSVADLMQMAASPEYIYMDQDILNSVCSGRVHHFDMSWNVLIDHQMGMGRLNLIKKFTPVGVYGSYMAARSLPRIIHYAGSEKPWLDPDSDFSFEFWAEARQSPYYEKILSLMSPVVRNVDSRGILWRIARKIYHGMRRVYRSIATKVRG